jgi:polar amino acid transport system permease protein
MNEIISNFFNVGVVVQVWPLLMRGLGYTLLLTVVCLPLSVALALALACISDTSSRPLRTVIALIVDFFRAIPPLVLLIFLFYALPLANIDIPQFAAAAIALVLNNASYFTEIFRSGLAAVPVGQREAARSSGMSWTKTMALVVAPQGVRNVLPDAIGNGVELFKQTAIVSAVSIQELLRAAQIAQGMAFNPSPLIAAALMYFLIAWPLMRLSSRLEHRAISR